MLLIALSILALVWLGATGLVVVALCRSSADGDRALTAAMRGGAEKPRLRVIA